MTAEVRSADGVDFDAEVPVLIVGAGAAGLCAALAAAEEGIDPVVIERDPVPSGSTALSAGLIPAAGTRFQREKVIEDNSELFARDLRHKARGEADPAIVETVAREAGLTVEWLADKYGFAFDVIDDFNYPGHSALRMHGLPSRSGRELIDRLRAAAEARSITILTGRPVETLFSDADGRIRGVGIAHGETIACKALVLACNGYGANPQLVRKFIPEMADALYFGHPGNCGDAVLWGEALGAQTASLSGYQGHGSVATPHNILITWAAMTEGGFQVNVQGARFSDESLGYSEHAADVLKQQGEIAFDIFDARIAGVARQFKDFQDAEKAGALLTANSITELAALIRIAPTSLAAELEETAVLKRNGGRDRFGRDFSGVRQLTQPFHAIKVTGALFHTQGGLSVNSEARVLRRDVRPFPNLFAAGGAAAGVSGGHASGYLSGNGLLTATVLGQIAGREAGRMARPA